MTRNAQRMLIFACATGLCGYAAGRLLPLGAEAASRNTAAVQAVDDPKHLAMVTTSRSTTTESFAARYADLARRAEQGEAAAAREMAQTITECATLPALQSAVASFQIMLDPASRTATRLANKPASLARIETSAAKAEESARARSEKCAGIGPVQLQSRAHWLYLAGRSGDAHSALAFGRGDFMIGNSLDPLEQVPFWREHAEEMLRSALAGGEVEAAASLAQAYDPEGERGALQVVPLEGNALQAYAYYAVLGLAGDGEYAEAAQAALERLAPQLSVAQRVEAERLVSDICALDLGGRCNTIGAPQTQ